MNIEQAKKAIETAVHCSGCRCIDDNDDCNGNIPSACRVHLQEAARTIIAALEAKLAEAEQDRDETFGELNERNMYIVGLEAELAEAKKVSSGRYDVINKQAVTILSMRNCGNCAEANDGECLHYYNFDCQQGDSGRKSYIANWRPGKQVVK